MNRSIFLALGVLMMLPAVSCRKHVDPTPDPQPEYKTRIVEYEMSQMYILGDSDRMVDLDGDGKNGDFFQEMTGLVNYVNLHNTKWKHLLLYYEYSHGVCYGGYWTICLPIQGLSGNFDKETEHVVDFYPKSIYHGELLSCERTFEVDENGVILRFKNWNREASGGILEPSYWIVKPSYSEGEVQLDIKAIFFDFVKASLDEEDLVCKFKKVAEWTE